jgi:hypothetical protein
MWYCLQPVFDKIWTNFQQNLLFPQSKPYKNCALTRVLNYLNMVILCFIDLLITCFYGFFYSSFDIRRNTRILVYVN